MITLVIMVILIVLAIRAKKFWQAMLEICLFVICFLVLVSPVEGYHEPQVDKTIELTALKVKNESEKLYYVKDQGVKFIYACVEDGKYEERTLNGENIVIFPCDVKTPSLKKIIIKPKKGLFTLIPSPTYIRYVFYIPEDSVIDSIAR